MVMNEWNAAFGWGGVSSEVNDRSPIELVAVTQYRPLTADRSELGARSLMNYWVAKRQDYIENIFFFFGLYIHALIIFNVTNNNPKKS